MNRETDRVKDDGVVRSILDIEVPTTTHDAEYVSSRMGQIEGALTNFYGGGTLGRVRASREIFNDFFGL
jgi:hypothetical protein